MTSASVTFETRAREIEIYFSNIERLIDDGVCDRDFLIMLKANAVVMLYNLIEATVTDAFDYIHDEIRRRDLQFDDLSEELKLHWFKRRFSATKQKSATYATFECNAKSILDHVIQHRAIEFMREDAPISGNLDARQIRNLCRCYGIGFCASPQVKGGIVLEEIKNGRNGLAHGMVSFVEYGRNLTMTDLIDKKGFVLAFMEEFIRSFDEFCKIEGYRISPIGQCSN